MGIREVAVYAARVRGLVIVSALAIAGCGLALDVSDPDPEFDAGPRMDAAGRDAGETFDAGDGDVAVPDAAGLDAAGLDAAGLDAASLDADRPDAGHADDAGASDAGMCPSAPPPGACWSNRDCETIPGTRCRHPRGACLAEGTCETVAPCDSTLQVCGCDGESYPSECMAFDRGISVLHAGPCAAATVDCVAPGAGACWWNGWAPCYNDRHCEGMLGNALCVGSAGCGSGQAGVCLPNSPGGCFRGDVCSAGQLCRDQDISASRPRSGRCEAGG